LAQELWRLAAGVDVEVFGSRALEACCRCTDVEEAQRYGAMEL